MGLFNKKRRMTIDSSIIEFENSDFVKAYNQRRAADEKYADVISAHEIYDEKSRVLYSVLNTNRDFESVRCNELIQLCLSDINLSSQYREYFVQAFPNCEAPRFFPAFKRLAMVYEKKGMHKEAIEVCAIAIDMGFDDDRTVGMMYGRIAKLCKASGLTVDDKYLYLS